MIFYLSLIQQLKRINECLDLKRNPLHKLFQIVVTQIRPQVSNQVYSNKLTIKTDLIDRFFCMQNGQIYWKFVPSSGEFRPRNFKRN